LPRKAQERQKELHAETVASGGDHLLHLATRQTGHRLGIVAHRFSKADSDGHQYGVADKVVSAIRSLWNKEACR